jgi:hypothetical protein
MNAALVARSGTKKMYALPVQKAVMLLQPLSHFLRDQYFFHCLLP